QVVLARVHLIEHPLDRVGLGFMGHSDTSQRAQHVVRARGGRGAVVQGHGHRNSPWSKKGPRLPEVRTTVVQSAAVSAEAVTRSLRRTTSVGHPAETDLPLPWRTAECAHLHHERIT